MIVQTVPAAAVLDLIPAHLADALDALFLATLESDREAACVLKTAREGMRALAWNRYAAARNREYQRLALTRRLRAHAGWRAPR